jgi:DNA modification methylase
VVTSIGVTHLGRSAQHLARNSATRIAAPAAAACFAKYEYVTRIERAAKLIRGDVLVELIDRHGLRAIDIARRTGERPADLSEMYAVAKTFPPESRPVDAVYNHLLLATRVARKFPELALSPADACAEIGRVGLTQHRDVTRHFDRIARDIAVRSERRRLPAPGGTADRPFNLAFHCRFQELLPRFPDGSIQVLSIDPPYVFGGRASRTYRSGSARSRVCDADRDSHQAISVTLDVLRDWQPKLAKGGVLLLWQPWQSLLRPIEDAIERYEWEMVGPVIWDKGRTQPGRFDSPYSSQGEMLWVLHRAGDQLTNHNRSRRDMILRFPPLSFPGRGHRQIHGYEKPVALCEHLLRKHSGPGDVAFDSCGCTGSMSVAAIRLRRKWVYAESNAENFRVGVSRITAEQQEFASRRPRVSVCRHV